MPPLPPMLRHVTPVELQERIAAERRDTPFLLYIDGERRQRIVELAMRSMSVGREEENDVPLPWDTEVSRVHAVLDRIGTTWTISDDGLSRNGSFVNGTRLRGRRRLDDGDVITLGGTQIVFVAGPTGARTTAITRRSAPPQVSPAESRVLAALCRPTLDGPFAAPASNREIAEELVLSVETVKSHMHALFERFEIADMPQNRKRAELVHRAFERGAVPG
jgi:pSer/pThr/pTyr-binding forkhead associated (FHA) protein